MKISKRINSVIGLIESCDLIADIGCDHGYVCIESVQSGKCKRALACDVARGPLEIAAANIRENCLEDRISCILSDGLKDLPDGIYPDHIIIAGMGGMLIRDILKYAVESRAELLKNSRLILSPHSDIDELRHYLIDDAGFLILKELCIYDEGKYYFHILSVPGSGIDSNADLPAYGESDYLLGKYIDPSSREDYLKYLEAYENKISAALEALNAASGSTASERKTELQNILKLVHDRKEDPDHFPE